MSFRRGLERRLDTVPKPVRIGSMEFMEMIVKYGISPKGSNQDSEGMPQSRYIACLVNDKRSGMSVLGIGHKTGKMDLDVLSSFFSAVESFSKGTGSGSLKKVTYGNSVIIRTAGSRFDAWLIAYKADSATQRRDRAKLVRLVKILEANEQIQMRADSSDGDVRGLKEYIFEIIKAFPFHTIDLDFMNRYNVQIEGSIEDFEKRIPYCKGSTHWVFETVSRAINDNRSIEEIIEYFENPERLEEEDPLEDVTYREIMGVIDSLFNYGFLYFEHKILPGYRVRITDELSSGQKEAWGDEFSVGKTFEIKEQLEEGYWGVLKSLVRRGQAVILEPESNRESGQAREPA